MIELRDYQQNIVDEATEILRYRGVVYLSMEMRLGKTLTSLSISKELDCASTLLVTKKKAIDGIQKDIDALGLENVTIINFESVHKVAKEYDMVIVDEAHSIAAFPKPSLRAVQLRDIKTKYHILMSGTPMPESASQLYHQFWICKEKSPFYAFNSFYKWAKDFVNVKKKRVSHSMIVNDYSEAYLDKINIFIDPVIIRFKQVDAGFSTDNFNIKEHLLDTPTKIDTIIKRLKRDGVVIGSVGTILADTPVKKMSKEHQIISGTVILEDDKVLILDDYKAKYIGEQFKGQKAVVFYKYQAELDMLKPYIDPNWIVLQIQSGSTGLTLSDYDCIVYLTLDFSCVNYTQSIERLNYKGRESNNLHFILSHNGIDRKILEIVRQKKDFSVKIYQSL